MTQPIVTYRRGARLPNLTLDWLDGAGNNLDLTSAYTLSVKLYPEVGGSAITASGSLTGGVGTLTIAWSATDLDQTAGRYVLRARAVETSTSKPRDFLPDSPPVIQIVDD